MVGNCAVTQVNSNPQTNGNPATVTNTEMGRHIANCHQINRDKLRQPRTTDRHQHAYWTMFLLEKRQLPYKGIRLYIVVISLMDMKNKRPVKIGRYIMSS